VVRSDFKIDEDWERKLRERERREYGKREREMEIRKKKCVQGILCLFLKKCCHIISNNKNFRPRK